MIDFTSFTTIVVIIVVLYLLSSIKILREYERGVIFRLGRLLAQPKGPGIVLVFAPVDRMVRVSLRVETLEVPPQGGDPGFGARPFRVQPVPRGRPLRR